MKGPTAPSVALLALLALFGARLLHTAHQKSFTVDEPAYVGTGLYLWESGDYHFARSLRFHPPLAYHLAGLPLLALDLEHLEKSPSLGVQLVHGSDPPPELVRMVSRAPFVLLACWGGLLVFAWAREIAGTRAALLAAGLYTFSPTILANAGLAHSDITVTVLYLQTLYAFWRWHRHPTAALLALCGVSLGLALLAKLSALLLLPTLAVLLLATAFGWPRRLAGERPRVPESAAARVGWAAALTTGLVGVAVGIIWLGYGGSFALAEGAWGPFEGWTLPGYLHALGFDLGANVKGRPVFFFGEISDEAHWYVLPLAFALKTPIALLALLGLALATRPRRGDGLGFFVGIPCLVYAGFACFVLEVPLGLRYLLPVYPLVHLFVAARLTPVASGWRAAVLVGSCAWLLGASLWIHPHYLAYFNELIGGPRHGYRYLAQANLDWGQDLSTLGRWLERRGNPPVTLLYHGPERPESYGIRATRLRSCKPVTGLVVVSATRVHGLVGPKSPLRRAPEGCFDWLLEREPIAQPGYSLLVYEIPGADGGASGAAAPR